MAINKKLIHFKSKKKFEEELANNNILDTSLVFIQDSKEIWTHGTYFDCGIEGLQAEIDSIEATMITAATTEGEEVTDYVLMASDVEKTLGDSDKPISQAAVKSAINSI